MCGELVAVPLFIVCSIHGIVKLSLHCYPLSSWQFSKLTNCYHDLRLSSDLCLQYAFDM